MDKMMMINYRDEAMEIRRKVIDDMEFCVHGQYVYFTSNGRNYEISLESVIQVYTTDT